MWKWIVNAWKDLNRSIYTGSRLKANLRALTAASIFCGSLGIFLMVLDYQLKQPGLFIAAAATTLASLGCGYFAAIAKKREIAILFPVIFCAIAFTVYTIVGVGDGIGMLWTMLLPIGICYFVSVKHGILLSLYYSVFFLLMFYSPLRIYIEDYYSEAFIIRFPILYISMGIFTAISMIQYHRGILLENEYADQLNKEVAEQTRIAVERADKLENLSEEMVETLAVAIDAKDEYTNGHSFRVSWYSLALARELGWSEAELKVVEREALLHDIGKIGVPDSILNKPSRLTEEEYMIIQMHTTIGGEILSRSESLLQAAQVAAHHHERYDGKGYPDHLKGEEIPVHARLVGIADSYDAMHFDRVYRKGLPKSVIREELVKGRGSQYDPEFLDVFLDMFDRGVLDEVLDREMKREKISELAV